MLFQFLGSSLQAALNGFRMHRFIERGALVEPQPEHRAGLGAWTEQWQTCSFHEQSL